VFPGTTARRSTSTRRSLGAAAIVAAASWAAPALAQVNIPAGMFNITSYGASPSASGLTNLSAIDAAIHACNVAGGGTIVVPAGTFNCQAGPVGSSSGMINIGSNTDFEVDGTLVAPTMANWGIATAFIHMTGVTNSELSGTGTVDGNASFSTSASDPEWWGTEGDKNTVPGDRPRLVVVNSSSNLLIQGLTFENSPSFNLNLASGTNNDVTVNSVTISNPFDSPNTDGIDVAGNGFNIENCNISTGDDDVVVKPQSTACSDIVVNNCTIGTGHGISVGGETNDGLDGMSVTNCTFNGTTNGLRLKGGPGEGGIVKNVSFSNLTMTGVTYPILMNSWYDGGDDYSSQTPELTAVELSDPTKFNVSNPGDSGVTANEFVNGSLDPFFNNISYNNITATGGSGQVAIIYGLNSSPTYSDEPARNIDTVSFNNVSLSGALGADIYYASNLDLSGLSATAASGANMNTYGNSLFAGAYTLYGAEEFPADTTNPAGTAVTWVDTGNTAIDGNFALDNGAVYSNAGSFTAQNNRTLTGTGSFDNTGVFQKSIGTGTTEFDVPFTNEDSGDVEVNSGMVRFSNGLSSTGIINVSGAPAILSANTATLGAKSVVSVNGGTFTVDTQLTNAGTLNVSAGTGSTPGNLTVQGNLTNSGALNLSNAAVSIGSLTANAPGTITATAGSTINVAGDVVNNGNLALSGSALNFNGTSGSIVNYGSLTLSNAAINNVSAEDAGTLTNYGVMTVLGSGESEIAETSLVNNGTLVIGPGYLHNQDKLTLNSSGTILFQIGGTAAAPSYGSTDANFITFGGTLNVAVTSGWGGPDGISLDRSYTVMQADIGTRGDQFANVANGGTLYALDGLHSFTVSISTVPSDVAFVSLNPNTMVLTSPEAPTPTNVGPNNTNPITPAGQNPLGQVTATVDSTNGGNFSAAYYQTDSTDLSAYGAANEDFSLGDSDGVTQIWVLDYTDEQDLVGMQTVILHFDPTDVTIPADDEMLIWHDVGGVDGTWDPIVAQVDPATDTITFETASFSPFVLGGAVPEPASAGLLAIFAFGALSRRRRKMMNVRCAETRNSNDE